MDRALSILGCFDADTQSLTLADLAKRTSLYKSTILRLAVSLDRFGYLSRGEDGRFRLGPSAWRLGASYRASFNLAEAIRPVLSGLSARTIETASYYIREGDVRICLYRSEPNRSIRHSVAEGANMPLQKGASGKVLLAFSGDTGPDRLAEADQIRRQGFAVSLGERDPEVAAVAVPVIARGGETVGALSVSGLINRFDDAARAAHIEALMDARDEISRALSV